MKVSILNVMVSLGAIALSGQAIAGLCDHKNGCCCKPAQPCVKTQGGETVTIVPRAEVTSPAPEVRVAPLARVSQAPAALVRVAPRAQTLAVPAQGVHVAPLERVGVTLAPEVRIAPVMRTSVPSATKAATVVLVTRDGETHVAAICAQSGAAPAAIANSPAPPCQATPATPPTPPTQPCAPCPPERATGAKPANAPAAPSLPRKDKRTRVREMVERLQDPDERADVLRELGADDAIIVDTDDLVDPEDLASSEQALRDAERSLLASSSDDEEADDGDESDDLGTRVARLARRVAERAREHVHRALSKMRGDGDEPDQEMEAAREAQEEAVEAARAAQEEAREAAREAEMEAREAAREAHEEAREAAREAEEQAREARRETEQDAREAAREAEEEAREAAREAEEQAREAEEAAREAAEEARMATEESAREPQETRYETLLHPTEEISTDYGDTRVEYDGLMAAADDYARAVTGSTDGDVGDQEELLKRIEKLERIARERHPGEARAEADDKTRSLEDRVSQLERLLRAKKDSGDESKEKARARAKAQDALKGYTFKVPGDGKGFGVFELPKNWKGKAFKLEVPGKGLVEIPKDIPWPELKWQLETPTPRAETGKSKDSKKERTPTLHIEGLAPGALRGLGYLGGNAPKIAGRIGRGGALGIAGLDADHKREIEAMMRDMKQQLQSLREEMSKLREELKSMPRSGVR